MKRDPGELVIQTVGVLETLNIPYVIVGGFAVLVWGRPRFTADIDIVIQLAVSKVEDLQKALQHISPQGYIDKQMIVDAIRRKSEFNFIDPESGMKVDFFVQKDDVFTRLQIARRVKKDVLGKQVYFQSPEDLILSKLLWSKASGSEKQVSDVQSVIDIMGDELDWDYLKEWAQKLNVELPVK